MGLPLIIKGFRGNSCKASHFTEADFTEVLKIPFVTEIVNSPYVMYCKMGALLIQMLY